jgi:hypothetical protein
MAEAMGEMGPQGAQRLLNAARWDAEAVRDDLREYIVEHLGEEQSGVLIVDETGFLKKGEKSVGVARQYTGTAGRIENAQVGMFVAYASEKGAAFVDRALYLPREEWADDPLQCEGRWIISLICALYLTTRGIVQPATHSNHLSNTGLGGGDHAEIGVTFTNVIAAKYATFMLRSTVAPTSPAIPGTSRSPNLCPEVGAVPVEEPLEAERVGEKGSGVVRATRRKYDQSSSGPRSVTTNGQTRHARRPTCANHRQRGRMVHLGSALADVSMAPASCAAGRTRSITPHRSPVHC